MEEAILDQIYFDLYSTKMAFPEIEEISFHSSPTTTYTLNKHDIFLNIDNFIKSQTLETYNYAVYKAAHELAHVKCIQIGHTADFKKIFLQLTEELKKNGKYSDDLRITYENRIKDDN